MLDKKQAAEYLNITVKAVENLVQKKKLEPVIIKGRYGNEWRFTEEQLDTIKQEREQMTIIQMPRQTTALATTPVTAETVERVIDALKALKPKREAQLISPSEKLLLTVKEAALVSGISEATLRVAMKSGDLRWATIGRGSKIHRDELTRFVSELWTQKINSPQ